MFGLKGKFQRRRESNFEQESNLTTHPRNAHQKSKNVIRIGYNKNGSMWLSDWSSNKSNETLGHPINFEMKDSGKRRLLFLLITVTVLFLLFIVAIMTAYALNIITIKFPPSSTTNLPYPFITPTPLPNYTHEPFLPIFPTPMPPFKPPVIATLPVPTDRLQKQTFLCKIFLINQANEAYNDHNRFEYRQTSQKIQNAIRSQLLQTTLQPYLENAYVWYMHNSGPHLAVEFSTVLLVPTHTNIGVTSIKNVLRSILPGIEEQLNGTRIDRNNISVQYLYN